MAKQQRNTIKNWFKRGLKPIESQFHDWLDSFVHKDDSIAISNVTGLQTELNGKASVSDVADLQTLFAPVTPLIFSPNGIDLQTVLIEKERLLTHIAFRALDNDELIDVERLSNGGLILEQIALEQGKLYVFPTLFFTWNGQETIRITTQSQVEVWIYLR